MPDNNIPSFIKTQYEFAAHLRNPEVNRAPSDIEDRRMKIYRELIYNNIESFISSGFPILRSITEDQRWHQMVHDFVSQHNSETPYFLEISQEFLRFLQEEYATIEESPPFFLELAHYEWVELALDVSAEEIPLKQKNSTDLLNTVLDVSPLAWPLSYQFPVHRIGPEFQPDDVPEQPTFLVVHRNRQYEVKFLEANAVTIRLLQLLEESEITGETALLAIAEELNHPDPDVILVSGSEILDKLYRLDILVS